MEETPPAGYYLTNYQAIRLREMARICGFWRLPSTFWAMRKLPPAHPFWMPGTSAQIGCTREAMSSRALVATEQERAAFAKLGFVESAYSKTRRNINPASLDCSAFHFLNEKQGTIAICVYSLTAIGGPGNKPFENKALAFTAALETGAFSCSNERKTYDSLPDHIVKRMKTSSPAELYQKFSHSLDRMKEKIVPLRDANEQQLWSDRRVLTAFAHNVRRKLFIPMPPDQIAKAEQAMSSGSNTITFTSSR